jgi:hypothetical protein
MAATAPPTFKLVLVGDGGTGKVRRFLSLVVVGRRSLSPSTVLAYYAMMRASMRPAGDLHIVYAVR